MTSVAIAIAIVLAVIAALHAYWGAGGVWPGIDQRSCARAVAGFKGIDRMPPPAAAFAVVLVLVLAAGIALSLGGVFAAPPPLLLPMLGLAAATVFLGRGVAGFTPAWRRLTPELPFARNDVRYFSPLCLLVGAGLLLLSFEGLPA